MITLLKLLNLLFINNYQAILFGLFFFYQPNVPTEHVPDIKIVPKERLDGIQQIDLRLFKIKNPFLLIFAAI
jgi:hypothetical protein